MNRLYISYFLLYFTKESHSFNMYNFQTGLQRIKPALQSEHSKTDMQNNLRKLCHDLSMQEL